MLCFSLIFIFYESNIENVNSLFISTEFVAPRTKYKLIVEVYLVERIADYVKRKVAIRRIRGEEKLYVCAS